MEKPSTARIALKWGIISSVIFIIFSTATWMTDLWKNQWLTTIVSIVISAAVIFLACKEFKTNNNGFMSYGEGLGLGTLLSAVSGLIASIYSYIYTNFVDTTFTQKVMDLQREKMIEGGMTDEQVDQAMEMAQSFTSPAMTFLFGFLGSIFFGFIISLIISAILSKKKPEMEF